MESRRKKQYLVAGIMVIAVGMACVVPLPTREPGTPINEAAPLATSATGAEIMPSDASRLTGTECEVCE